MLIEYKGWEDVDSWIISASEGKYRSIDELRRAEPHGGFPFSENCGHRLAIASWMSREVTEGAEILFFVTDPCMVPDEDMERVYGALRSSDGQEYPVDDYPAQIHHNSSQKVLLPFMAAALFLRWGFLVYDPVTSQIMNFSENNYVCVVTQNSDFLNDVIEAKETNAYIKGFEY